MKSGSIGLQQHEYFLVQIDGQTKSGHRRFIDALRGPAVERSVPAARHQGAGDWRGGPADRVALRRMALPD